MKEFNFLLPLLTLDEENPDFNEADSIAEIEMLYQRNQAIQQCFYGKFSPNDLLDLIESHDINPIEYVNMVEVNIANAINTSTPLILPE